MDFADCSAFTLEWFRDMATIDCAKLASKRSDDSICSGIAWFAVFARPSYVSASD